MDKMAKKASGWKAKWIVMAGRLALVRFVLAALPIFQIIAIHFLKWIIKQLEKIQRAFLRAGSDIVTGGSALSSGLKYALLSLSVDWVLQTLASKASLCKLNGFGRIILKLKNLGRVCLFLSVKLRLNCFVTTQFCTLEMVVLSLF